MTDRERNDIEKFLYGGLDKRKVRDADEAGLTQKLQNDFNEHPTLTKKNRIDRWAEVKKAYLGKHPVNNNTQIRDTIRQHYEEKYTGKPIKVISSPGGVYDSILNKTFICDYISFDWEQGNTIQEAIYSLLIRIESNGDLVWLHPENVICLEDLEPDSKNIKRLKRKEEKPDRYGNKYIIELYKPEGEVGNLIYISSALRSLLELENGEPISFAIDEDKQELYVCKDKEGYPVKDGIVDSNVEWRTLYNTFNKENTLFEEAPKLILNVSHYAIEDKENPDYKFYLVAENWVNKKENKRAKFMPTIRDEEYRVYETPGISVGSGGLTSNSYATNGIGYTTENPYQNTAVGYNSGVDTINRLKSDYTRKMIEDLTQSVFFKYPVSEKEVTKIENKLEEL